MIAFWQILILYFTQAPLVPHNQNATNFRETCEYSPITLPLTVSNITYKIYARTRLYNLNYYSKVSLEFQCLEKISRIHFHASLKYYKLTDILVESVTSSEKDKILSSYYCEEKQIITLDLEKGCQPSDKLRISLKLNGILQSKGVFVTLRKPKRIIIMGEPTNFRYVFPSFDDPRFRAKYQLFLVREKQEMTTSNMIKTDSITMVDNQNPCINNDMDMLSTLDILNEELICDVYPFTTYTMPTYLFSFVLAESDMKTVKLISKSGVEVLWYMDEEDEETEILESLNETISAISYFEEYFNSSFPGKVMQNIRVNMNMADGEELWNMVAYSINNPPSRATIAHEVAHHWFGNIATVADWNSLWLKEGTSFYFHTIYTEKNIDQTVNRYKERYIDYPNDRDPLACRDPIMFSMTDIDFRRMYNWRRYHKPGSLLHMVQQIFLESEEKIRNGFRKIIRDYYENTINNKEFWSSFEVPKDFPDTLENIINPWLLQNSVPTVFVNVDSTSKELLFSQKPHHRLHLDNNVSNHTFPYVKILVSTSFTDQEVGIWIPENKIVRSNLYLDNLINENASSWLMIDRMDIAYYYVHFSSNVSKILINHFKNQMSNINLRFTKTLEDMLRSVLNGYYDDASVVVDLYRLLASDFKLKNILGKYFYKLTISLIQDDKTIDQFVSYMKKRCTLVSRFDKATFHRPQGNLTNEMMELLDLTLYRFCIAPDAYSRSFLERLYLLNDENKFFYAINCYVENDAWLHKNAIRNIYLQLKISQYFARKIRNAYTNNDTAKLSKYFYFLFQNTRGISFFGNEWCQTMKLLAKDDAYNPDNASTACAYKMVIENGLITCRISDKYWPAISSELERETN